MKEFKLDLSKLVSVTTDGAPAMMGKNKGFATLLEKHLKAHGYENDLIKLHCIIHQEALCAKNLEINEVMGIVVKATNLILSRGLHHRQFQQLLLEANEQYSDLLYFCEVRWLSRGKMLQRFYELLKEIDQFLLSKNKDFPELRDPIWISKLAFLTDITHYLNQLNINLQGSDVLVNTAYELIVSFEEKLILWKEQIKKSNFSQFPSVKRNPPSDTTVLVTFMDDLIEQFASRFADLRSFKNNFKLFGTPFSMELELDGVSDDLQMELIDLKNDNFMKEMYLELRNPMRAKDICLLQFYQLYLQHNRKYSNLTKHAKQMACIFGSTYSCEQLFSKMKFTKNKMRTNLTDSHLDDSLRLAHSNLKPNIEKLSKEIQHRASN